ncbi:hypothetical protein [Halorubellus litoreus]|uniref:Uncharacterized protein n=1 Tax=Halorubellus litoreus TaxID=755308 RepID=A0ABD5VMS8_9EURY
MLDVEEARAWLGRTAAVVAVVALVLLALLAVLASVTTPVQHCPPLGNGGAQRLGEPVDAVANGSEAVSVVREHLADRRLATTSEPASTSTTAGTERTDASTSTMATTTVLDVGGHFRGSEQVHGDVAPNGETPVHFHVHVDAGPSTIGYVVTADGDLYRIIYGDC